MTKVQDTCATCILKMVLSRESQINDAHQVPIATISKADMIVSWNLSICSLWQNAFFQRNKQKGRLSVYPNLFAFGGRIMKKNKKNDCVELKNRFQQTLLCSIQKFDWWGRGKAYFYKISWFKFTNCTVLETGFFESCWWESESKTKKKWL